MKKLFTVFLTFTLLSGIFSVNGQIVFTDIKSENDWNNAFKAARDSGKLVFLDIYATWCGPCKYLESAIYPDSALGDYYNQEFVNLKLDGESPFGRLMARKFRLNSYPTMYYLESNENLITSIIGVRQADVLLTLGGEIVMGIEKFASFPSRMEENSLTAAELQEYYDHLIKIEQKEGAARVSGYMTEAMEASDILSPEFKSLVLGSPVDINSPVFRVVDDSLDFVKTIWSPEEVSKYYENVYNQSLVKAIEQRNDTLVDKLVNDFLPSYLEGDSAELEQGAFVTRKIFLSNINNWEGLNKLVVDRMSATEKRDSFLYQQAYEIITGQYQSIDAQKLALNWMLLASVLNPNFDNLFMTSYLYFANGDSSQSGVLLEKIKTGELTEDQLKAISDLESRLSAPQSQ